jgi:hypothetical protein
MKRLRLTVSTLVLATTLSSSALAGNIGGLRTTAAGNIGGMRTNAAGNIGGLRTNSASMTRTSPNHDTNVEISRNIINILRLILESATLF